jgi:UDP-N-acetylmuramate--alanine ligase
MPISKFVKSAGVKPLINFPRMGSVKKIHLVGIGGIGMSGIAEVLLSEGYVVSGSDQGSNTLTQRLATLGAVIFQGHEASHVDEVDVVVQSSAVLEDNVEIVRAHELRIPVVPRAGMLAELMRFRYGIAIAGTHGKTTTTSLTASLLAEAGLDPTFLIGGKLNSFSSNARLGKSAYLVAEADESDGSFLMLNPMIAVVTNIDSDHLENYQGSFANVKQAFLEFIHKLPFYGLAVLCIDDENIQEMIEQVSRPFVTYGFSELADVRVVDYQQTGTSSHFKIKHNDEVTEINLSLPGKHNALNTTAAYLIAKALDADLTKALGALKTFQGVGRRFQNMGELSVEGNTFTLIDDYAHHPVEVAVTLQAAKAAWPTRRIVAVFQPHRYSRTAELLDDFGRELSKFDALILMDVFSAGEQPSQGVDSKALAKCIRGRQLVEPILVADEPELMQVLASVVKADDVVVMMGAGTIGRMVVNLAKTFYIAGERM